jgi:hypothetical protein
VTEPGAPRRVTRVAAHAPCIDGSSDTRRWVPRFELASLPLVGLAEHGARLAFCTA